MSNKQLAQLHKNLAKYFNEGELRNLCFELGIDYEILPARGKSNKARELISYLHRRGQIPDLLELVRSLRPKAQWPNFQKYPLKQFPGTKFGNLPPLPLLLVGREKDIHNLRGQLLTPQHDRHQSPPMQSFVAICGWPGVGKTTLAATLAHDSEIHSLYSDGVLWASLGQQPNLFSELAAWAQRLEVDEYVRTRSLAVCRRSPILQTKIILV